MYIRLLLAVIISFVATGATAQTGGLVNYVNTLQGTNSNWDLSYGNTYPTIATPFPVNSWSPQTGKNGDGWKYTYPATTIRGFEEVHQCSPWMGDYGVFTLMPVIDSLVVSEEHRATAFTHANEIAKPHYYKVKLNNGIVAEISPAERSGHIRFSFPKKHDAWVVLDGYTGISVVTIYPDERKITGFVTNGTFIPKGFKNYFVITFNQPFVTYGTWENQSNTIAKNNIQDSGKGRGAYMQFKSGAQVEAKIASSYISIQQAERTLQQELGNNTLEQTEAAAGVAWDTLFNRVKVEGGTEEQKATFYSCLFRASLFSHKFYEIKTDGSPYYYSPYDGQVHDGYMYTDNGFWDTFRAQFPLSNILHPTMEGRYMQSLIDAQQQCGFFPTWSNPGMSGVMVGNHAISLLADAWAKGIHTFDPAKALQGYLHEVTNKSPWGGSSGREGHDYYFTLGYVPYPDVSESGAKTLEYAYDDFCAYQLAKLTGNTFYQQIFARQMFNYKNVFDTTVGFVHGRLKTGAFTPNFDPVTWGDPFTEGNPWQWNWSVFHDIQGLIKMMGGQDKFNAKLDSLFTAPNTVKYGSYGHEIHEMKEMVLANMGQYAQGNEPVDDAPYLYNYSSQPWKAQQHVREIINKLYNAGPSGYPGDEDQGAMSSWYVLGAIGLYAVCPGTDQYVIGSPTFNKITLKLENGKQFIIEAHNTSPQNVYIQSATLNSVPYTHNFITYNDIMQGGVLHFEMGSQPNMQRGIAGEDKPFSVSTDK